jgi:hypothetical protein
MDKHGLLYRTCKHVNIDQSKLTCTQDRDEFWTDEMCQKNDNGKLVPCEAYEEKTDDDKTSD